MVHQNFGREEKVVLEESFPTDERGNPHQNVTTYVRLDSREHDYLVDQLGPVWQLLLTNPLSLGLTLIIHVEARSEGHPRRHYSEGRE